MGVELSVHNVSCDGAHFSADSQHGHIEGSGSFKQGDDEKSGTIVGKIDIGPDNFVRHPVYIKVNGSDGLCSIP